MASVQYYVCSFGPSLGRPQTLVRDQESDDGWRLVWSDELRSRGLIADSSKWTYDTGGGGWGTMRKRCTAPPVLTLALQHGDAQCVLDGNGNLVISAINTNSTWTSTRMKTESIENLQYGASKSHEAADGSRYLAGVLALDLHQHLRLASLWRNGRHGVVHNMAHQDFNLLFTAVSGETA